MGTISDKLAYTKNAVSDIKTAIIEKGVTIDASTALGDYGQKVRDISSGGIEPIIIDPTNKYIYADGSYMKFDFDINRVSFYINNIEKASVNIFLNRINYIVNYNNWIGCITNEGNIILYNKRIGTLWSDVFKHDSPQVNYNYIIRNDYTIMMGFKSYIKVFDLRTDSLTTRYLNFSLDLGDIQAFYIRKQTMYVILRNTIFKYDINNDLNYTTIYTTINNDIKNIYIDDRYILFTEKQQNDTILYGYEHTNPTVHGILSIGNESNIITIDYDVYDSFILCKISIVGILTKTFAHIPYTGLINYSTVNNKKDVCFYLKVNKLKNTYIINTSSGVSSIIVHNQFNILGNIGLIPNYDLIMSIVEDRIETDIVVIRIKGYKSNILNFSTIYVSLINNYGKSINTLIKQYVYIYDINILNSTNGKAVYILTNTVLYSIQINSLNNLISLSNVYNHYYDIDKQILIVTDKTDNKYITYFIKNNRVNINDTFIFVTLQIINNEYNVNTHTYICQNLSDLSNIVTIYIDDDGISHTITYNNSIPSSYTYVKDKFNNIRLGVANIDSLLKLIIINSYNTDILYPINYTFATINHMIIEDNILAITHTNGVHIINLLNGTILYHDSISNQSIVHYADHNAIYIMNNLGIDKFDINSNKCTHIINGDYGNGSYYLAGNIICSNRTISNSIDDYNTFDISGELLNPFKGRCIPILYSPDLNDIYIDSVIMYPTVNGYDRLLINDITKKVYSIKNNKEYDLHESLNIDNYYTNIPYFSIRTYVPGIIADVSEIGEVINEVKHKMI